MRCATLTDLCWGSPAHVFGLDSILNALDLLLVAVAITRRVLFGFLQSGLQAYDPLSGGPQALLQFRNLTAEVRVVPHQLQAERVRRGWGRRSTHRSARRMLDTPACGLWLTAPGCSPGSWSSVSGPCCLHCRRRPSGHSAQDNTL